MVSSSFPGDRPAERAPSAGPLTSRFPSSREPPHTLTQEEKGGD